MSATVMSVYSLASSAAASPDAPPPTSTIAASRAGPACSIKASEMSGGGSYQLTSRGSRSAQTPSECASR